VQDKARAHVEVNHSFLKYADISHWYGADEAMEKQDCRSADACLREAGAFVR